MGTSLRMVGISPGLVKRDLPLREKYFGPVVFRKLPPRDAPHFSPILAHAIRHIFAGHESDCANNLTGVTRMATRSFTVRHTCSHSPHPTQRSVVTMSRWLSKSMANASVGHFDAQAWHPCPAVQTRCETTARPIRICARPSTGSSASVAQAAIQGVSSQRKQGI